MGKSKTIQEHEDKHVEFQDYLKTITTDLKEKAEIEATEFNKKIAEFYGKNDYTIIQQGERWDYRQKDEFNLESITQAITQIVDAAFSEESGGASKEYRDLALDLGKNIVLNALKVFEMSSAVEYSHAYTAETVAPGVTMHLLVVTDSYMNKKMFGSDSIIENYIIYRVGYSEELMKTEAKIALADKQIALMKRYLDDLSRCESAFMEKFMEGKVTEAELVSHSNMVLYMDASITNCLRKLGIEIPLTAKTIRRDVAKIQEIVESNHYSEAGKNALHTLLAR